MQNFNTGLAGSYAKESGLDLGNYSNMLQPTTVQPQKPYSDNVPFINGGNEVASKGWLSGLNDWSKNNQSAIGTGFGVAQLGLGLAGFLEGQKTAGLQRDVLKQQIGSNKTEIANRRKFLSGMSNLKSVAG